MTDFMDFYGDLKRHYDNTYKDFTYNINKYSIT